MVVHGHGICRARFYYDLQAKGEKFSYLICVKESLVPTG